MEENRAQGEEDQALQNRVAKKAKKRAKAAGRGKDCAFSSPRPELTESHVGRGKKAAAAAEEEE